MTITAKHYTIGFYVLAVITIASIFTSAHYYSVAKTLQNPNRGTEEDVQKIVAEVGKFILLPKDEVPTLATVSDPEKLKNQAFFASSQIGDKVLIYSISRKAILWRPSTKKIIEVSSINSDATAPTTVPVAKTAK